MAGNSIYENHRILEEIKHGETRKLVISYGELANYDNSPRVDFRVFERADKDSKKWIPTKKGIAINEQLSKTLCEILPSVFRFDPPAPRDMELADSPTDDASPF